MSAGTAAGVVRTFIVGAVGRITIDRPQALNAITLDMVLQMQETLLAWRGDPRVKAVVVDGEGDRAFCAGGDIRRVRESGLAGDGWAESFWREEFRLDQLIARYPKPYVALIDGVTMGGGLGLSVYGSFRVAGDRTLAAMPETGIGYYPDVGGSYFLSRLRGEVGTWLALTGARLGPADTLAVGLATHFVPTDKRARLVAALEVAPLDDDGDLVEATLAGFDRDPGASALAAHLQDIDRLFQGDSVAAILARLAAEGTPWADEQLATLRGKSPTSLEVTLRALREAESLDLEQVLERDLALSVAFLDPGSDFYEGVRAVVVDKDHAPKWSPAALEDVSRARVDSFFAPERRREIAFFGTGD